MKKFAKMSLVAAVAVAGTVASAQPLAEAIKNVDVSGTIVYRYNDYNSDDFGKLDDLDRNTENDKSNYYKAVLNLKSKVNDDVTANVSIAANNGFAKNNYTKGGDDNVEVELTKVNFAYSGIKNTTVILGKQGIPTPWTVASDSDGAEQTGTGILALSTWGPVTFAGAYFNQTNLGGDVFGGDEDLATVGIMANIGPVALDAWYANLDDTNFNGGTNGTNNFDGSFDSYTVGAKYGITLGEVKLGFDARYTNLDFDEEATNAAIGGDADETENELWKVALSAKMGIFGASVLYAETGKDGGLVALDDSAKTAVENWTTALNGQPDASMFKTNINVQVLPKLNIALNYNDVDSDADDKWDEEEIYTQITYKMSKNFMTYVRLGQNTQSDTDGKETDSDVGRLQIQYTF